VPAQERLHRRPLHADPAAVDDPDLAEAARLRRAQVLVDDRGDVAGQEGMQIEAVLDR
jgi:hypothetical protein